MRFVIVTSEEPFHLPAFVERVAGARPRDLAGIVVPPSGDPRMQLRKSLHRYWEMYGPVGFARQAAAFAGCLVLDKLDSLRSRGRRYSVAAVARRRGIPLLRPPDVNAEAFLAELEAMDLDVIVSVAGSQIFRAGILSLPSFGCVNVHSALLPKYRGVFPTFWVLANGETETGVSVHLMDEKLDNGPILGQRRVPIEPGETQHTLMRKTKAAGAELLLEVLAKIEAGTVTRLPNDAAQATYYSNPKREDVRRFRAAGHRFW